MSNERQLLRIRTANKLYEAACKMLGREPITLDKFSFLSPDEAQYHLSIHRITTVIKAGKEGKALDYDDPDVLKWSPWWWMDTPKGKEPGSGFQLYSVDYSHTRTYVGARLSTPSKDMARHIATVMKEDWKYFCTE